MATTVLPAQPAPWRVVGRIILFRPALFGLCLLCSILTFGPPNMRVLSIFCCGVVTGMKIVPSTPKCRQA